MKGMISMVSHSKELIELIDIEIKKYLKEFSFINEKIGKITQLQDSNGKYTVVMDEKEYLIAKKDNDNTSYQIGDVVIIRLFNGDFSRKYIECKQIKW
jgi:hypothetical protein